MASGDFIDPIHRQPWGWLIDWRSNMNEDDTTEARHVIDNAGADPFLAAFRAIAEHVETAFQNGDENAKVRAADKLRNIAEQLSPSMLRLSGVLGIDVQGKLAMGAGWGAIQYRLPNPTLSPDDAANELICSWGPCEVTIRKIGTEVASDGNS